jgi:hypothetical protein
VSAGWRRQFSWSRVGSNRDCWGTVAWRRGSGTALWRSELVKSTRPCYTGLWLGMITAMSAPSDRYERTYRFS